MKTNSSLDPKKEQTALFVKEDGLIYVNEVPEEPQMSDFNQYEKPLAQFKLKETEYNKAIASAKENAVLVVDQDAAYKLLKDHHADGNLLQRWIGGIYPIPGLQWEVKGSCPCCEVVTGCQALICHYKKVAILSQSITEREPSFESLSDGYSAKDAVIEKYLYPLLRKDSLDYASFKYAVESGTISGGLRLAIHKMLQSYADNQKLQKEKI